VGGAPPATSPPSVVGTPPSQPTAVWKPYRPAYKEHEYLVWPFAAGRGRGVASTDRPGRSGAAATGASSSDRRATNGGRRSGSAGRRSVTSGHGDSPADQPSRSASRSSTFRSSSSGHGGTTADKPSRSTSRSSTSRRVTFREGSPRAGRASPSPPRPPRRRNQHNQRLRDIARAQVYRERCEQRWAEKAPRPLASDESSASVSSGQVTPGVIPSPSRSGFPTGDPAPSASSPAGRSDAHGPFPRAFSAVLFGTSPPVSVPGSRAATPTSLGQTVAQGGVAWAPAPCLSVPSRPPVSAGPPPGFHPLSPGAGDGPRRSSRPRAPPAIFRRVRLVPPLHGGTPGGSFSCGVGSVAAVNRGVPWGAVDPYHVARALSSCSGWAVVVPGCEGALPACDPAVALLGLLYCFLFFFVPLCGRPKPGRFTKCYSCLHF